MDFRDTPAAAEFRAYVKDWLAEHLVGEFAVAHPHPGDIGMATQDLVLDGEKIVDALGGRRARLVHADVIRSASEDPLDQRLLTIAGGEYVVAFGVEQRGQHVEGRRRVVDSQHPKALRLAGGIVRI